MTDWSRSQTNSVTLLRLNDMIKSIEIKSGFAADLPALKGRKFDLGEQCTVLFGPNGCGKTTLLKVAAAYSGITTCHRTDSGGWSSSPRFHSLDNKTTYPELFKDNCIGKVVAEVDWDGMPTFYNSATLSESGANLSYFVENAQHSPDGMMDMKEQLGLITSNFSDGELRQYKIGKLIEALKLPPSWPPDISNHTSDAAKKFAEYVKSKIPKDGGKITLLWDEPDRSLSFENQINFWSIFLPNMSNALKIQIVIATHSYVPMFLPEFGFMKIIDVQQGYKAKSRKSFLDLIATSADIEKNREEILQKAKQEADPVDTNVKKKLSRQKKKDTK
jgi:predicted ATPase